MLDLRRLRVNSSQHYLFPLKQHTCTLAHVTDYVCERPVDVEKLTKLQLPVIAQNQHVKSNLYSSCPSGHVTHGFLSCDLQSLCWAHFASTVVCESPLLPVPPTLLCSNHAERVPYPLVCDHRPDCTDHSDENFCVFPDCLGPSFQCGGKQVTHIDDNVIDDSISMLDVDDDKDDDDDDDHNKSRALVTH